MNNLTIFNKLFDILIGQRILKRGQCFWSELLRLLFNLYLEISRYKPDFLNC